MKSEVKPRINAHSHLLPYPHQIPKKLKDEEIFWVDDDRQFMYQKNWRRPVTSPSFFLDKKLEWMEAFNIDQEVIITLSQLYCNGYSLENTELATRFQNDFNADIQAQYPEKFIGGFVIQPAHLELALSEITRCVEDANLKLLCLPTHYLNKDGQWISTADRALNPIYERANDYGIAIEFHPYDAPKFITLPDQFWRFHLVWMCAQTADHYHFFTSLDFIERYPNLRVCYAHGNQFGQINVGRRERGFLGRPDLFKDASNPFKYIKHPNIFFDSIVHDVLSFELLVKRSGAAQVVAGLDNPYPLGEVDFGDFYPGQVIDEAVDEKIINKLERENIWHDNVLRWLYGNKSVNQ
ncbi:MAG: amidohydrolase family protein [Saprospiraceae bacterium]|nr:amidohydrolase family protein [Saprospiraceae bacterium]